MVCDIGRPCQCVRCVYDMFMTGSRHVPVAIKASQRRIMGDHTVLCCQGRTQWRRSGMNREGVCVKET